MQNYWLPSSDYKKCGQSFFIKKQYHEMVGYNIFAIRHEKRVVVEKMQKITNFAKICNMPGK